MVLVIRCPPLLEDIKICSCCLYVFYYYYILSYSLGSIFFINVYIIVFLFNTVIYLFLLLCLYSDFMFVYLHRASWHSSATLTEVFPCFFLSCKANARVKPAKMGYGPHSSKIFVFYILFVLHRSLYYFVCKCVLPPGGYPIALNKYIVSREYLWKTSLTELVYGKRYEYET